MTAHDPSARDDPERAEVSRRTMLRGTAVGGLALPLLAACGGTGPSASAGGSSAAGSSLGAPSSSPSSPSSGGRTSSGSAGGGVSLRKTDVPVGGGTILAAQNIVVTQPRKGEFKAFSAICTHQGCPVTSVTGGSIICTCHGSRFSITDGSPVSGPAPSPLPAKKVSVSGDRLSIT